MRFWHSFMVSALGHFLLFFVLTITPMTGARIPDCLTVRLVTLEEGSAGSGVSATGIQDGFEEAAASVVSVDPVPQEAPPAPETNSVQPVPAVSTVSKTTPRLKEPRKTERTARVKPAEPPTPMGGPSRGGERKETLDSAGGPPGGSGGPEGGSGAGGGDPGGPSSGFVETRFGAADGPRFARRAEPKYPALARRLGKEGTVLLRVTIDETGRAVRIEVLRGAGCGFDEEAVQAVKDSTFDPAKRNGRPVSCKALLPVRFELKSAG